VLGVYWEEVLWENGRLAEEEVAGVCEEGVCLITHDNQPGDTIPIVLKP